MDLGVSAARPNSDLHWLDPSVGGLGPHGLTVRMAPHVLRPNTSIASRLTSGDEWPSRPSCRGRTHGLEHNFPKFGMSLFRSRSLKPRNTMEPFAKFAFWRTILPASPTGTLK